MCAPTISPWQPIAHSVESTLRTAKASERNLTLPTASASVKVALKVTLVRLVSHNLATTMVFGTTQTAPVIALLIISTLEKHVTAVLTWIVPAMEYHLTTLEWMLVPACALGPGQVLTAALAT